MTTIRELSINGWKLILENTNGNIFVFRKEDSQTAPVKLYNSDTGVVTDVPNLQIIFKFDTYNAPAVIKSKAIVIKGGSGSGNFGHGGIPGHQGGSSVPKSGKGPKKIAGVDVSKLDDEHLQKLRDFIEDQKIKQKRHERDERQKLIDQLEEAMRSRDAVAAVKLQAQLEALKD